ncbi:hypothetical protein C8R45DRAFT_596612 [Mycena sanguinolenta]|nr:hypothetical protein C8R45DRAFT_596612 [Mycena sanguinolenta]
MRKQGGGGRFAVCNKIVTRRGRIKESTCSGLGYGCNLSCGHQKRKQSGASAGSDREQGEKHKTASQSPKECARDKRRKLRVGRGSERMGRGDGRGRRARRREREVAENKVVGRTRRCRERRTGGRKMKELSRRERKEIAKISVSRRSHRAMYNLRPEEASGLEEAVGVGGNGYRTIKRGDLATWERQRLAANSSSPTRRRCAPRASPSSFGAKWNHDVFPRE